MIENKCENCMLKESDKFYCCDCKYAEQFPGIQHNFLPKEEIVRKDEREKIKDFIISRGEMNEKQILKELYEHLD